MTSWKEFKENMQNKKIMYIMRGVSGSGKSTKAKQIVGPTGQIFSTDDFFGPNYDFDHTKIGQAHEWNQNRVKEALDKGVSPIVVDNTNVSLWEMKPYVEMAKEHNYEISFQEPDSEIWSKAKEVNALLRKLADDLSQLNSHGVSASVIAGMISRYMPGDESDILASKKPF